MSNFLDKPFVPATLALGICIFAAALIFSFAFYSARSTQGAISVTGSAKQAVRADLAKWTVSVTRTAFLESQAATYSAVARDAAAVKAYFIQAGLPEEAVSMNTIVADQDWSYQSQGGPVRYNVHQEITVESNNVEKVEGLAQDVATLISRGYAVSPRQPEYYVSNLPELRVALLGKAIEDAKARAESIAKSGGTRVGALQSANSGVVQVMSPNSTNVEDYGSYDTSSIEKEVSVTARASFSVR
jgi:hypothetical protein